MERVGPAVDLAPWLALEGLAPAELAAAQRVVADLRAAGHDVAADAFVSPLAAVSAERLVLGARSYLAGHTHVRDDVVIGADCSVNAFTEIRGTVRIGDAVRIGASTSIIGFNHGFDRLDVPVFRQPHVSRGIEIGDNVWIGAHVVVLDGVTIGAHAVIGAGAIVTRDVPAYAIAVGNPARVVRDRRDPAPIAGTTPAAGISPTTAATPPTDREIAADLARLARRDIPAILDAAFDGEHYRDRPGARPTVRAHCDAVELAALVGQVPAQLPHPAHVARLTAWQDDDGALPGPWEGDDPDYHVLCVGYALDLLGAWLPRPPAVLRDLTAANLPEAVGALDWAVNPWGAGARIDTLGTALTWAAEAGWEQPPGAREALVGWLATHRDPQSGLWGRPAPGPDWRLPVNGTYRLVRGTLAQWGVGLGDGETLTDTVLRHARSGILDGDRVTACDALDVVHLLWWAGRTGAAGYRAAEVAGVARLVLRTAREIWVDDEGAPFAPGGTEMTLASRADPRAPTLQGTEMWLATAWYAAALLGVAVPLGCTPCGIHRPHPRPAPPPSLTTQPPQTTNP